MKFDSQHEKLKTSLQLTWKWVKSWQLQYTNTLQILNLPFLAGTAWIPRLQPAAFPMHALTHTNTGGFFKRCLSLNEEIGLNSLPEHMGKKNRGHKLFL